MLHANKLLAISIGYNEHKWHRAGNSQSLQARLDVQPSKSWNSPHVLQQQQFCGRLCNLLELSPVSALLGQLSAGTPGFQSAVAFSRAGQGRAGQGRAGQGRAGQGRAGQGRAGQGRAGQGQCQVWQEGLNHAKAKTTYAGAMPISTSNSSQQMPKPRAVKPYPTAETWNRWLQI